MDRTPEGPLRASFRDPDGVVIATADRVVRGVRLHAVGTLDALLASEFYRRLVETDCVVTTRRLEYPPVELASGSSDDAARLTWFEHERVAVPTYACEWSPAMLHAAATLTLGLATQALDGRFGLKDATPDNILFKGPRPIFVDVLSFERRDANDPMWLPYAQFVRTFLLPLLANRDLGVGLDQVFLTRRDGLAPDEVYRWCRWSQRVRSPFLSLVTMPTLLTSRAERTSTLYQPRREANPEKAMFVLRSTLARLQRALRSATPAARSSAWSGYEAQHDTSYTERKTEAVTGSLSRWPRSRVLDVGCNTGHFSLLAARAGASVVAIDADPVVVDRLWERARRENLPIQTLVANLAHPTPATGWMNREREALLDRLRKRFDAVWLLAVLHHLLATERIPLDEIVELVAGLTTDLALVEFVSPDDELFRRLARGRDALYRDLTPDLFEQRARRRFEVLDRVTLIDGRRWLYTLRTRAGQPC